MGVVFVWLEGKKRRLLQLSIPKVFISHFWMIIFFFLPHYITMLYWSTYLHNTGVLPSNLNYMVKKRVTGQSGWESPFTLLHTLYQSDFELHNVALRAGGMYDAEILSADKQQLVSEMMW